MMYSLTVLLSFDYLVLLICLVVVCLGQQTKKKGQPDLCYSHCGSDFIFTSVLCKIIDVMTPFSEVE